jgi:hypothetical protein
MAEAGPGGGSPASLGSIERPLDGICCWQNQPFRPPGLKEQESLWSNLGMLLAEHNMSVLALHKRLQKNGVSVNLKTLYRLAVSQPLQKFDARIVKPICLVLGVDLSELISLEKPELILLKLDPVIQARITNLLDQGNQGTITKRERAELEGLVDKAERSVCTMRVRWSSTVDAGPTEPEIPKWAQDVDPRKRVRQLSQPKCIGY